VVYNSLLKKERQEIHERTGRIIEKLFPQHLSEKSEILAFHFTKGKSLLKAVEYLMQSGTKSLNRYAVVESHQYYKEAYQLLTGEDLEPDAVKGKLIQLLNSWTPVFYFRGNFRDLEKLLTQHITLAESLEDKEQCGMFYVCLGISFWAAEKFNQSYHYLQKALRHGARNRKQANYQSRICLAGVDEYRIGSSNRSTVLRRKSQKNVGECKLGTLSKLPFLGFRWLCLLGVGSLLTNSHIRQNTH